MAHSEAWFGGGMGLMVGQRWRGSHSGSAWERVRVWVFFLFFSLFMGLMVGRERGLRDWESEFERFFFFFHDQIWSDSYSFQIHSNSGIYFSWKENATIWFFFFFLITEYSGILPLFFFYYRKFKIYATIWIWIFFFFGVGGLDRGVWKTPLDPSYVFGVWYT